MSRVKRLIQSYGKYISIPWKLDAAAAQRVIFCVYPEMEELRLRARIDEFELVTRQAGHEWLLFDLTDTFAQWLSQEDYVEEYFQEPQLLQDLLPETYCAFLTKRFDQSLQKGSINEQTVVVLMGVGTLFGFAKVKDLIDLFAPRIKGRLLVLFPGSYENNNYRLLDGYDGWNYLAVPITADKDF
ncbi:BREX protein BrxB domain-containing protein [Deltaproteobacteria bacterium TL4]